MRVNGAFWIGYWADFSEQPCGYYVAADLDGFGGCPFTYCLGDFGGPTGWNNVSVIFGPTQAIGIGAWVTPDCSAVPTGETSWGRVKALYE